MGPTKLFTNVARYSSMLSFSSDSQIMLRLDKLIKVNKLSSISIRTVASTTEEAKGKLKTYDDIPGPPGIPILGNFLGFKNPEHGHDPKYILKTGKHLWDIYGDMFRLEVPGKVPIIW